MKILRLDHVSIHVKNVPQAVAWYNRVLGLRHLHADIWGHHPAFMAATNGTGLALYASGGVQPHIALGTDRAGFLEAQKILSDAEIAFELDHQPISDSIYLVDPFGQRLEITVDK